MIFVTDENIQVHTSKLLEAFDRTHQIRPLLDYVEKGTADAEWMAKLAAWTSKPVVISGDSRILKNRVEWQALKEAKLMWVYLRGANIPWETFAWKIIRVWPDIRDSAVRALRPAVFEVSMTTLKVEKRFDL